MKRWFIGVLAVVIVAIAIYALVKPFSSGGVPPQVLTAPVIIAGIPSVQYQNLQLGFSIWYPATATSSDVDYEGFLPVTQTSLVSFALPRSMFAGTNLGEAGVYIGATTTPAIVAACTQASRQYNEIATSSAMINGTRFGVFTSTGVGAGNIYEEKVYRTVQNGACLEIVELLHSGNIDNYPQSAVVQFDHAKFQALLEAIVHTYRSIPTGM